MDFDHLIAGGGIVGGLTMVWGHVKEIYGRISGVLLTRAELKNVVCDDLIHYLFREWKRPPPITSSYASHVRMLRSDLQYATIPFRVRSVQGLNFSKGRFVLVSFKGGNLHLTSMRGLFDFEAFIAEAVLYDHKRRRQVHTEKKKEGRFWINDVIGREMMGSNLKVFSGPDEEVPKSSSSEPGRFAGLEEDLSFQLNGSFMYDREEYAPIGNDPFDKLFLEPHVSMYVEQAREWQRLRNWYTERRIPWRRGWLLHGPGGCGKSSLARAIAEDFEYPLYRFHLSTLSDQEFIREWQNMQKPCVALFEDFDAVFNGRESMTKHKSLSFDCILNQISGVDLVEGVFLIITTNCIDKIDPAIGVACDRGGLSSRPGRVDTVIEMGAMSEINRRRMALVTLKDWPHLIDDVVAKGEGVTPVQFQEMLIQIAFEQISAQKLLHRPALWLT
jgi:hypothetical protein